ncbi:MAG: glutaredoxin 3 [Deltaproteobacteria bacterium]|nr:glutaredoxin 3 [Deltaproteobacteria bacterium]
MKRVIIYTTGFCPYCEKAKRLLDQKGVAYQEIRIDENLRLGVEMKRKSGGLKSVPQIFIDDFHVGGCDDLYALERENKLDGLLKG